MSSVIQELESFGGGVFLTHQGVDSRVKESELWRAFEQPVVVWVHGAQFDDSGLERLVAVVRRFPHIRRFRFTSTRVTPDGVRRLYEFWPNIPIDGVAGLTMRCSEPASALRLQSWRLSGRVAEITSEVIRQEV